MIVITQYEDRVTIKGHAHYAEPGKDIVCAAISALTQTFIASVEELTAAEIKYVISSGNVDINYEGFTDRARVLLDSFFIGCELIAREYPENVRIAQAWKA